MDESEQPHAVGRHRLGPHVVGTRVVVRHLLPDGRATDVLGVCTSWGPDRLVVEGPAGPVEVGFDVLVTGKPVPPRASVRARVPAREVERHVAALWSSITTEPLGAWVLRASPPHGGRLRRRGNSALAMEDPGMPLADAVAGVHAFYERLGQESLVQVPAGSDLEAALAPLGLTPLGDGDAHAQLAPVAQALRATRGSGADLPVEHRESEAALGVDVGDGAARGRAVLSDDWLLVEGLEVAPGHRRRGLATAVVADLLDWGASRGARTALLHVEVDNEPALRLYDRLGFRTHHTNRYLIRRR